MQYKEHDGTSVGDMSRVREVLMRIGSLATAAKRKEDGTLVPWDFAFRIKHEKEIAAKRRKIEDMGLGDAWGLIRPGQRMSEWCTAEPCALGF